MRIVDRYRRWLSSTTAGTDLSCSQPLRRASMVPPRILGRLLRAPQGERLNLFDGDELLGWKLRPNADTWQWLIDVRARYTVGPEGRRNVAGAHPAGSPLLYFIGCSFTFGYCVNDDETFAAHTAREHRVENWAVPGYGPGQHYLLLTQRGLIERAARAGATIIDFWNPIHLHRVWRRRSWLVNQERFIASGSKYLGNPLFEFEGGALAHRGLVRIDAAVPDDAPVLPAMEWRINEALLRGMHAAAAAAGVRFMVALLPELADVPRVYVEQMARMRGRLDQLGIDRLDLCAPGGALEPRATFPFMHYPTPLGHEVLAQRLASELALKLKAPARPSARVVGG